MDKIQDTIAQHSPIPSPAPVVFNGGYHGEKNGTWTCWIERGTGELRNRYFSSLPDYGSFRAKVQIAHAVDAIDVIEIPDSMLGNNKQTLDDLRAQSAEVQRKIAGKARGLA